MPEVALFMNGIYRSVLEEIRETQSEFPDCTLFLQPYSGDTILMLQKDVPTPEAPVTLYASTTDDLSNISYVAEIVGWEDKTAMIPSRRQEVNDLIQRYQPGERLTSEEPVGLYNASKDPDRPSKNLLHIRRMVRLDVPFSVGQLIKDSNNEPHSTNRTMPGRWVPVHKLV